MKRFAIYYAPHEHSPLWTFGSSILGFDASAFMDVDYPPHALFQDPAALGWTAGPRRYGFHATLKAPFRLAEGRTEDELAARLDSFAAARHPFTIGLKLAAFRDFLALVLSAPSPEIDRLADDCVRGFDEFRAPMTASEHERRHPERLDPSQLEKLDLWGYPFVLDDFRFHMTLTGDMPLDDQMRLAPVLEEMFGLVPPDTVVDAVCLFVQEDAESRFRLASRHAFRAA